MNLEIDIYEHNKMIADHFLNSFKINKKIFDLDIHNDINEIMIHHYIIREMYLVKSPEIKATLKGMEYKTGLSIQQVRTAIRKLEEKKIIEVIKGSGKTPSIYKYIIE